MDEEDIQSSGTLAPQHQTYDRQKCFIAFTGQAPWSDDLLSACRQILSRPDLNLELDHSGQHFNPDVPLRKKVLELIANARYGIYDLSYWKDETGRWQIPRNVFIELGIAIALNRPALLLRHASNSELELPECLKSVSRQILEFSGELTLVRALEERLPQWLNVPPEHDWWNRFCIFGSRTCEYREAYPQAKQWSRDTMHCHISDGADVDREDFRGVVQDVLGRFSDVTGMYLDRLPIAKGYDFLLCSYCQTVRSTPLGVYRITPHTTADTFIAIGMSIAVEAQFDCRMPKILLAGNIHDVPSLLSGYDVVVARNDKERREQLRRFFPTVIQQVKQTAWKPRPLPFVELITPLPERESSRSITVMPGFIISSTIMKSLLAQARQIASVDTTVLITGESGTGKELVARYLHNQSPRARSIFLPFNCTAAPKEIIDSQLFGHRRGAFTEAKTNYPGIIKAADGGTLFLDEVADLALEVQPRMLHFLEEGEIQPLGDTKPLLVDVRIITATSADLKQAVQDGRFRKDLFYRINILTIDVPPLRERREEIPVLAEHFLEHFSSRSGKRGIVLSRETIDALVIYHWPGNVRELRNEIERVVAYASSGTLITPDDLLSPDILGGSRI